MVQVISRLISAWPQVAKRSLAHWKLLSSVVIGVVLASAIMSGTVIYFDALRELALKNTLSKLTTEEADILVKADRGPTTVAEYNKVRNVMNRQFESRVDWMLRYRIRGGKSSTFFLTEVGNEAAAGEDNARSYFAFMPTLQDHIQITEGGLPREQALSPPGAPLEMEALVPKDAADKFGVGVGDTLSVVPFWKDAIPYGYITISGLFERTDPNGEFWHLDDTLFKSSTSISFRTVPFYISETMFMDVLGVAFKDMDSSYSWLLAVDKGRLNADNALQAQLQVKAMRRQLATTLFSFRQLTELDDALADYDRRLFFSKVPMFIILVLISVVVLYYVITLSSLLVDQQRGEIALLRSRGATSAQVLAVFVLEGATISVLAIVVAPLFAGLVISFLGFTPAFADLSGNSRLTVDISAGAYLLGGLGGLLSFAALLIPAIQASNVGVTRHRQESGRPTQPPFFQRFYLDVMLLVIGVLLFRQLSEQGSVVAVGLFGDVAVDQVLLAVPALILVAFAMVLIRLFPMAVRFLSGDAPDLIRLITYITVAILAPMILVSRIFEGSGFMGVAQVLALLALAAAYWKTDSSTRSYVKAGGMALQAVLVALVILIDSQLPIRQISLPLLVIIVPLQLAFIGLRRFSQIAPVGVSMGLWQMARNPTHYARLSLLLILMSGLGIFAASFGGTLSRSFEERALYATGADIKLEGVLLNNTGTSVPLIESYESIEGVEAAVPVIRANGTDLSKLLGNSYTMFATDGSMMNEIGWFRDDFSDKPMAELIGSLPHDNLPEGILLPVDTRSIGVRLRPDRIHPSVVATARIRDANDRYFTYNLGLLNSTDWTELETGIQRTSRFGRRPPLQPTEPLILTALAVHEINGRNRLRAGSVSIDEIYVRTQSGERVAIESFDDLSTWNILRATPQAISDGWQESTIKYNGDSGGASFIWSEGSPLTARGVFHGPPTTPISVLASREFMRVTGHKLGDEFEVSVRGHRVQVRLVDVIKFFPTLDIFDKIYLISDRVSLIRYTNLEATSGELRPTEIWISTNGNDEQRARLLEMFVDDRPFLHRRVQDRVQVLADSQIDPLVEAGWRALLFMAFGAVLILSCLGFLVHAYVSFRNREMQFALMRTIGFSMKQLTTLVWLEQILVIIAGLLLGTIMGGRLGEIIMPFLAHDDRGSRVIPPFILEVNWPTLAITYGIMVVVFAFIIGGMIMFIRRISLERILRLGEM